MQVNWFNWNPFNKLNTLNLKFPIQNLNFSMSSIDEQLQWTTLMGNFQLLCKILSKLRKEPYKVLPDFGLVLPRLDRRTSWSVASLFTVLLVIGRLGVVCLVASWLAFCDPMAAVADSGAGLVLATTVVRSVCSSSSGDDLISFTWRENWKLLDFTPANGRLLMIPRFIRRDLGRMVGWMLLRWRCLVSLLARRTQMV